LIAEMERQTESNPMDTMLAAVLSPVWERTDFVVGGVEMADTISIDGTMQSDSSEGAKELSESMNGLLLLGKAFLRGSSKSSPPEIKKIFQMGVEGLSNAQIKRQSESVTFSMTAPGNIETQLAVISPMILSMRQSADRATSANNLRSISIAMHTYHDANKSLPPAILISQSGKKYSWRIALLPYLGHQKLYDAYRFDEDWDSAHNLQITKQMPHVFRHPSADANSNSSSYFVITGDATAFTNQKGTHLESISDGTSNTICCVESKRDVHWAKPEDIPFESKGMMKTVGGFSESGFNVSFCDASVHFISSTTSEETLQSLLTVSGGEALNSSALRRNDVRYYGQKNIPVEAKDSKPPVRDRLK